MFNKVAHLMSDDNKVAPASQAIIEAKKIFNIQIYLVATITLIAYFIAGQENAQSSLFGGFIVLCNTWLSVRRLGWAEQLAKTNPGRELAVVYQTAIQRFVITLVLFAVGMGVLKLAPVPMIASFAVVQLSFFFTLFPAKK